MRSPQLVMRTDPTPAEIEFLEDRLYEFNAKATGIFDALSLAIFGRDIDLLSRRQVKLLE